MNSDSPYLPPASNPELAQVGENPAKALRMMKVFGVLHVIFATIGIIVAIGGIIFLVELTRTMGDTSSFLDPKDSISRDFLNSMQQLVYVWCLTFLALFVTAIPLAVAGVLLVRRKPGGRIWSNVYAVTSFATKLTLPFLWPSTPADSPAHIIAFSVMCWFAIMAIYPGVALILLNRPAMREWAAGEFSQSA